MIKIYSTPTCPYCHLVKNYFKEKNIEFEDINVAENEESLKEMMDKSGQMGVPVIDIEGVIVVGFNRAEIDRILAEKNKKNE